MQNNSQLYNTSMFIPPSIIRKLEMVEEDNNTVINNAVPMIGHFNNIKNPNESQVQRFLNFKLRNRDVYTEMRNKTLYSRGEDLIGVHSSLNSLL